MGAKTTSEDTFMYTYVYVYACTLDSLCKWMNGQVLEQNFDVGKIVENSQRQTRVEDHGHLRP